MSSSWLEIESSALQHNLKTFRSLTSSHVSPVLKGNAYGHGLLPVLSIIHDLCDCLYVFHPEEGCAIRKWEKKERPLSPPIRLIVLGAVDESELLLCSQNQLEVVIPSASWTRLLQQQRNAPLNLHLHIDTGLSREGLCPSELTPSFYESLRLPHIRIQGIMSHFANTEDVTQQEYAQHQLSLFQKATQSLKAYFPHLLIERHFAASAPALILSEAHLDRIRLGISFYGFWPSPETRLSAQVLRDTLPELQPALSWKCQSQTARWIAEKSYVGYGCTYRCQRRTRIALFPVGYSDGYPRIFSHRAYVLIDGKRCPVLGRVMMNYIIVDVTEISEKEDYEATLLGKNGEEVLSAETLAQWGETLHYEIITRLSPSLRRVIVP